VLLVDTDVLVDVLRGHGPAVEWFDGLDELPAVPGLVVMELVQDADSKERMDRALKLVAPLPVVWPSEPDCEKALSDFREYHLSHGLGLLDSLIAACAVGSSASLCTFNVKHYRMVPDLQVMQPYKR
jgi:hypothetical protein